jgi:sugar/nucleoside kinase (ribokinase family)
MMRFFREGMLQMIGDGVDLLFANEEEACELSGIEDIGETVETMKRYAKTFAITRGGKGALVFDGEDLIEIEPHQVEAVDTLGAGDMFAGAFLYGLTHSLDYADSGRLASLLSADIVTRFGPRLDPHQTVELLRQFRTGNL